MQLPYVPISGDVLTGNTTKTHDHVWCHHLPIQSCTLWIFSSFSLPTFYTPKIWVIVTPKKEGNLGSHRIAYWENSLYNIQICITTASRCCLSTLPNRLWSYVPLGPGTQPTFSPLVTNVPNPRVQRVPAWATWPYSHVPSRDVKL